MCNDPCWKLKVFPGNTKCVSSLPTLVIRKKRPWDCSPGQDLWERLEEPRASFVPQSCELKCSFVLLITKGQRKVLEAAKVSDFLSCQCPVWPRAPLGKTSFVYPRPAPSTQGALPWLRWGLLCTHTFVSCHIHQHRLTCARGSGHPCRPGFQLQERGTRCQTGVMNLSVYKNQIIAQLTSDECSLFIVSRAQSAGLCCSKSH